MKIVEPISNPILDLIKDGKDKNEIFDILSKSDQNQVRLAKAISQFPNSEIFKKFENRLSLYYNLHFANLFFFSLILIFRTSIPVWPGLFFLMLSGVVYKIRNIGSVYKLQNSVIVNFILAFFFADSTLVNYEQFGWFFGYETMFLVITISSSCLTVFAILLLKSVFNFKLFGRYQRKLESERPTFLD